MPRISLCLIARDEGDVIERCLESARPYVDEVVVVDTGSNDDTRGKAKACGAKVVVRTWTDDFSAARNAALAEATGEWLLVLDADEWVEGGDAPDALRRRLEGVWSASTLVLADKPRVTPDSGSSSSRPAPAFAS